MKHKPYTQHEERHLARLLAGGREPHCPRCGAKMGVRDVDEPEGVAYVRDRIWLTCETCHRNVVLDRRRTRKPG